VKVEGEKVGCSLAQVIKILLFMLGIAGPIPYAPSKLLTGVWHRSGDCWHPMWCNLHERNFHSMDASPLSS
jgi:hypothetical protein